MPSEPRRFARELRQRSTSAEELLWQALRGRRVRGLKVKRQVPVPPYTVDFLCTEHRLVVELDGRQHGWQDTYDAKRTEEIERCGYAVLRFRNEEVLTDLDMVLNRIAEAAGLNS
ncbi:endonuclease domain-containing protein [Methylobacterium sp. JK268]